METKEEIEIIEPIGYFIENDEVVIANPCRIPIKILEDTIKNQKKRKDKSGVEVCMFLALPFPLKQNLKLKGYEKAKSGLNKLKKFRP